MNKYDLPQSISYRTHIHSYIIYSRSVCYSHGMPNGINVNSQQSTKHIDRGFIQYYEVGEGGGGGMRDFRSGLLGFWNGMKNKINI